MFGRESGDAAAATAGLPAGCDTDLVDVSLVDAF
jgi:hypothetical protein